ncbi:MAG: hypothetical protein QM718_10525 [Steroidobacteraceae bacterium]
MAPSTDVALMSEELKRKRRVRRSALLLVLLALTVYGGFIFMAVMRSRA